MSDYLKDSSYGQLASSLLGQQKSSKKRDFVYSLIGGFLQNKQRKLKEGVTSSLEALNLEYDAVFKGNESRYRKADTDRALYESYQKNPEKFLTKKAIELFNADPSVLASGKNYSMISTLDLDSAKRAKELYDSYMEEAKIYYEELGETPEITALTFQDYNEAFVNEYKAKYNALKDDPAKQSLLASWADKLFPNLFDRKRAELSLAITNAEEKTKIIEDNSLNYIMPNEEVELNSVRQNIEENDKAILLDDNLSPEETTDDGFEIFRTKEDKALIETNLLKERVLRPEWLETSINEGTFEDDIAEAIRLGVSIPTLPYLKVLDPYNIRVLKQGVLIRQNLRQESQESWKNFSIAGVRFDTKEQAIEAGWKPEEVPSFIDLWYDEGGLTMGQGLISDEFIEVWERVTNVNYRANKFNIEKSELELISNENKVFKDKYPILNYTLQTEKTNEGKFAKTAVINYFKINEQNLKNAGLPFEWSEFNSDGLEIAVLSGVHNNYKYLLEKGLSQEDAMEQSIQFTLQNFKPIEQGSPLGFGWIKTGDKYRYTNIDYRTVDLALSLTPNTAREAEHLVQALNRTGMSDYISFDKNDNANQTSIIPAENSKFTRGQFFFDTELVGTYGDFKYYRWKVGGYINQ